MKLTILAFALAAHLAASPGTAEELILHRFGEQGSLAGWRAVNDGVMGGRSSGGPKPCRNGLRFSGILSLENNGGFSSIRKSERLDLSGYDGVRLKVRGDGRTYQVRFNTDSRFRGWPVSYSGPFETQADTWVVVDIPFTKLKPSFRSYDSSKYPFEPGKIQLLGMMLADKRTGPFAIEVQWIKAYRDSPVGQTSPMSLRKRRLNQPRAARSSNKHEAAARPLANAESNEATSQ